MHNNVITMYNKLFIRRGAYYNKGLNQYNSQIILKCVGGPYIRRLPMTIHLFLVIMPL
jgi:hypothetical protein